MTKIQIRKVNGVPMGREITDKGVMWGTFSGEYLEDYKDAAYPAPGCEEGEAEGELVWQYRHLFDKDWQNEPIHEPYFDMNKEHEISVHQGNDTRQIWRIVPAPEKVEVKEDDYKTITEDEVKNWCGGSFGNTYILERLTDLLKGEYSLDEARDDVLGFRTH